VTTSTDGNAPTVRAVSWNLANRVGDAARRQGEFLAGLDPRPGLVMFQEVNRRSIDVVCDTAGLTWVRLAVDLRDRQPDDTPVRQRGVAIAGTGAPPTSVGILDDLPLPERAMHATVDVHGRTVYAASYHAPPGVSWFEKKPRQAVLFAQWLAGIDAPTIFGADANTPQIDHPDFAQTRTHWHSGGRNLKGEPGDDFLWAATKIHHLRDALRRWLDQHPAEAERIRLDHPDGPLAVSHRTGKRRTSPGTARRFDSIWVSDHFEVHAVAYPYDDSVAAGSDHAAVIADLTLTE
jgi:hypothetical protein